MQFGVALALSAILSTSAWSLCGEPRPRLVCAEYFQSNVVVSAQLLRTQPVIDKDGFVSANIYHMKTLHALRGTIGPEFEIFEGNDSGRAGFFWKNGNSYLLFLFPSREKKGGYWGLDGCGNSGPLKQAVAALNSIQQISGAQSGLIQVGVGGIGADSKNPLAGRHVKAESSGRVFTGTSDNRGIADIEVPPGTYKVTVSDSGRFEPYDLSYDDPRSVVVHKGGCAQIQFGARQ